MSVDIGPAAVPVQAQNSVGVMLVPVSGSGYDIGPYMDLATRPAVLLSLLQGPYSDTDSEEDDATAESLEEAEEEAGAFPADDPAGASAGAPEALAAGTCAFSVRTADVESD